MLFLQEENRIADAGRVDKKKLSYYNSTISYYYSMIE